jgi:hypothetical protein
MEIYNNLSYELKSIVGDYLYGDKLFFKHIFNKIIFYIKMSRIVYYNIVKIYEKINFNNYINGWYEIYFNNLYNKSDFSIVLTKYIKHNEFIPFSFDEIKYIINARYYYYII